MKTRVIVSAVIEKGDCLLFGKKLKDIGPYPNTWHLIGGGLNEGEPMKEGIKREIQEESGIEVNIENPISFDEDFEPNKHGEMTHYIFLVFQAQYISGELRPDDDIIHLEWIEKKKLVDIQLNKPSIKLFKKIGYL